MVDKLEPRAILAKAYRDNGDIGAANYIEGGHDLLPDTQIHLLAIQDALEACTTANGEQVELSDHDAYRLRRVAEADCGCRIPAPFDEVADHVASVAFAEGVKRATPTTDARERVKVLEEASGLAWLAEHPRCALEHFGPVYGDDDDQSEGWRVMRENGSINDREWTEIGRGDAPAAAIAAARTALGNKETGA